MIENKLFASVALFRELYNENRDIYDILAELLKGAILYDSKVVIDSISAVELLKKVYAFDIPEAVIKTVLKRLSKEKFLKKVQYEYTVIKKVESKTHLDYKEKEKNYNKFIVNLQKYILEIYGNDIAYEEVENNFKSFLIDNGVKDKFAEYISAFILNNNHDIEFIDNLNEIKEGLILYQGITYSPDGIDSSGWTNKLTIYLDMEYLFHAVGYNGELFEDVFNDFSLLVNKINKKGKLINLKYFEETEYEIINFFYAAEALVEKKMSPDPSKTAMISILDGCDSKSDVLEKKTAFFKKLDNLHIKLEIKTDYYEDHSLNLEDESIIKSIKKDLDSRRRIDEEDYKKALSFLTKINVLREGKNKGSFREINHIFATGKRLINTLSHRDEIKNKHDMPFSVNLDFIINRFWFRLNQGFQGFDKTSFPKTFDMVVRAQIILSSQINNTISETYKEIKEKYDAGNLSKDEAVSMNLELRKNIYKPESITEEKLDSVLAFLTHDMFENHKRKQSFLEARMKEGENAKKELIDLKFKQRRDEQSKIKKSISCKYFFLDKILLVVISMLFLGIFALAIKYSGNDSLTTISLALYAVATILFSVIFYINRHIKNFFRNKKIKLYKNYLR